MRILARIVSLALAALAFAPSPSPAAFTDWRDHHGVRLRLAAERLPESGKIALVVEMDLEKGWKTYWRDPGDSGIPPRFDFSDSPGFSAGAAQFAPPKRFRGQNETLDVVGYEGEALFLIEAEASQPKGEIHLDFFAGVCSDICIPVAERFSIARERLDGGDGEALLLVERARSMLPRAPDGNLGIARVVASPDSLRVEANAKGDAPPELFAEAGDGRYVPAARLLRFEYGEAAFEIPLAGARGLPMRYTLRQKDSGIQQWATASRRTPRQASAQSGQSH